MSASKIIFFIFSLLITASAIGQAVQIDSTKADTVLKKPVPRSGIKSFGELITKNVESKKAAGQL